MTKQWQEALTTKDHNKHIEFLKSYDMGTVRNLALNVNVSKDILKELSKSPIFNVSYVARKRLGLEITDEILHPCITCKITDYSQCAKICKDRDFYKELVEKRKEQKEKEKQKQREKEKENESFLDKIMGLIK